MYLIGTETSSHRNWTYGFVNSTPDPRKGRYRDQQQLDVMQTSEQVLARPRRIKLVDLELSEPFRPIEDLRGYDAVQALVRLRTVPLGYVAMPSVDGRCPPELQERAVRTQLSGMIDLDEYSPPVAGSGAAGGFNNQTGHDLRREDVDGWPIITVVVCTRDRANDLEDCLDALVRIDYPVLDLLVVDNAPSSDAAARLVASRYPGIRYVCEPRPGLSWARNRGAIEARGDIVAYTEDDAIVDEGWVKALASAFLKSEDVSVVTGLVVPLELETESQIFLEKYSGFGCGFERIRYPAHHRNGEKGSFYPGMMTECGTGANMAFRKSLFDSVGLFDPALGAGTVTQGGEDLEMFFRVMEAGHSILYEPSAIVRHRHRRDYSQLRMQIAGWGTGFAACLVRSYLLFPEERMRLLTFGLHSMAQLLIRWTTSFFRDPGFPRVLLLVEIRGAFVGVGRYLQARRDSEQVKRSFGPIMDDGGPQ